MPELPEVETVRRGLAPVMEGARFTKVIAHRGDLRWPLAQDFTARLEGKRVEGLGRRAKYLLADLSSGDVLVMHLGMSGSFRVAKGRGKTTPGRYYHERPKNAAHDHVVFHMSSGARIAFNDPRRFGMMKLVPRAELEREPLLRALGPEPLGNEFDAAMLARGCKGKKTSLKAALADAIAAGGSSLRDHRRTDGELGDFQHNFRVYDRAGKRCPTPGCNGIIRRMVQSGRSTFF